MKKLTLYKTTGHLGIPFFAAIMIVLALMGCSSTHKLAGKKLTTEDLTLTYIDKAQASGDIAKLNLEHPLPLSERQMVFHMVALRYESSSLFGTTGPVFTKKDIQKTKRLLSKTLNKVHVQNIIEFEVESESGTTKGHLFASGGKLHWRFFEIQGAKYSLTGNPMAQYGTAWQLVPGKGQGFHVTDRFLGTKRWTNWIEAKIDLPAPENLKTERPESASPNSGAGQSTVPPQASSPGKTAPEKNTSALEEKLKFLKHLHDKQLIGQQEYERKRNDLLDQHF